jgi:hypothetical protein
LLGCFMTVLFVVFWVMLIAAKLSQIKLLDMLLN